ncbi:hypothetical protein QBC35DRAFT_157136 [Podospora australis]|uniref:Chitin biosynthesis protein CHS5 n=1 Tax=Podospora australis TaxID=1536484 RepID=A0AAN6WVP1_9PEZI|nr:hypothetical protein QBC35DRAFT_157136 [Podospora australis]
MLVSLTVGKVDAGVTVLLTPDKRLIEFPSILLPPDISSGSIVDINVARNKTSEAAADAAFRDLQDQIFSAFGASAPQAPILRCRNATQTSVVLEWDPIQLATADLISLALFRNGQKAGNIPKPLSMHTTKISGLAVDTEYTFHLVLRTTAGTFQSQKVAVRTHKMTDLSGITITTGILPAAVKENLAAAVERIGAKLVDGVRIDTTHFVTTEGRGVAWEKANELNIPVVRPEWVDACERGGRILGVTKFYLDAARVGPGYEEQTPVPQRPRTTSAAVPSAEGTPKVSSAQSPQPPQKELPPNPSSNSDDGAAAAAAGYSQVIPSSAAEKEEGGGGADSVSSESEPEDADEDAEEQREAQKVLADERNEKQLASRPKQPTVEDDEDGNSSSSEPEANRKEEDTNGGGSGGKSPGDGASFQDVAL